MLNSFLSIPMISRVRRNHGLEHATLHVLARRFPHTSMAGHSTASGFRIVGEVPFDDLQEAVQEALARLKSGERGLAIHPFCGTNFVAGGLLAGLAGALAMWGAGPRNRDRFDRLPLAISLATGALIVAHPLGLRLQEQVTTSGDPGELEVVEIRKSLSGSVPMYFIGTRG